MEKKVFENRTQSAVKDKIERLEQRGKHTRLAQECAKLDIQLELALAEEGFSWELEEWPEY